MRSTILHLVLVFSLAFNIAFAGIWVYERARPRPHRSGPAPGGPGGRGPEWGELDLTPEQEGRIRESWRKVGGRLQELRQETGRQRDRLFDLLQAEPPDEAAILETQRRIEESQEQSRQAVVAQMMETRALLSPEQRRKWVEAMRVHGQRLGAKRWRNGHARPGDGRPDGRRPRRGPGGRRRPQMDSRPGPDTAPPPEGEGIPTGPPPTR